MLLQSYMLHTNAGHVQSPFEHYLTGNRKEYIIRQTHLLLLWVFLGNSQKIKNIYIALDTATFNALSFSRSDLLHVNIPIGTENLHEETEIVQQSHPQPSGEEHRHFQDADIRDFPARHALHAVPALP